MIAHEVIVNRLILCSAAILIQLLPLGATAADWPIATLKSEFHEELQDKIPLSGNQLAGVGVPVRRASFASLRVPPVVIFVPKALTVANACVIVRSRDGRYRAANTYELPEEAKGTFVKLPFPTRYSDVLRLLLDGDVAALGTSGNCKDGKTNLVLPVSWGEPQKEDISALLLFVNGGRKRVMAETVGTDAAQGRCKRINKDHVEVFDTVCSLTVFENGDDDLQVKLTEYRLGNELVSSYIYRIAVQK